MSKQVNLEQLFLGVKEPKRWTKTEATPPRFTILEAVNRPEVRENSQVLLFNRSADMMNWVRKNIRASSVVAFDFETLGVDPHLPDNYYVGLSLAVKDSKGNYSGAYLETRDASELFRKLASIGCKLIAHNLFFDGAWILQSHPEYFHKLNFEMCTYLGYKILATEGWAGQTWGLKDAQTQLLGWTETNELELDEWLVRKGYVTGAVTKQFEQATEDERWDTYQNNNSKKDGSKKFNVDKSKMALAPFDVLGKYCVLDSISTLLLHEEVLTPAINRFRVLPEYINKFMYLLKQLIVQRVDGVSMDEARLREEVLPEQESKCIAARDAFLTHSDVQKYVDEYLKEQMEINYYAKKPAMYKKDGTKSKNYINWRARKQQAEEKYGFNMNSNKQLCWLFYDKLGYEVAKTTDSGEASIDKKVVGKLGEPGKLLNRYNILDKERQYIQAGLDKTYEGVLHPQFRVPGTLTGRLAGSGGLNLQQVPKSREYLECFRARPGYVWVQCDINSLEKVVLTQLSRDPAMLNLYGPSARPNDIYLFDGAHLPGFKDKILAAGYDPYNTTSEMIARVKQEVKSTRKKIKPASLGFGYGLGPKKYRQDMLAQGVSMTEEESFEVWKAYWKLYEGVKEYERELLRQHKLNRGWILNGIGRPIGIHADYTRDIVNRTCIAEGTLVHTRLGLKKIEDITDSDMVWDGLDWVSCDGVIYKGLKSTMEVGGTYMTPDHRVLVNNEMREVENVRVEDIEAGSEFRCSWSDVWGLLNSIKQEMAEAGKNLCRRILLS